MSKPFGTSCVVKIFGKSPRTVMVTMANIVKVHGQEQVALIRLLHQHDTSDRWTDGLIPWVLSTVAEQLTPDERSVAVIGWLSPHLAEVSLPDRTADRKSDRQNKVPLPDRGSDRQTKVPLPDRQSEFDPNSYVGLFGIAMSELSSAAVAMFTNGRMAALACRGGGSNILMLKQAFLASRNSESALRELVALGRISAIGKLTEKSWLPTTNNGHDDPDGYDNPIHPALAAPTIDHLCAYVVAHNPELGSCPTLTGNPNLANSALTELALTSADALDGSPSTRARVAAGGLPGFPIPPPDPFKDQASWRTWLNAPVTSSPLPVSRLLCDVRRRRVDLQEHFPDLSQLRHRTAYLFWANTHASDPDETGLPEWAIPTQRSLPRHETVPSVVARTAGVTVIGYLDSALGLGEAARVMVRNLLVAGESVSTVTSHHVVSPPVPWTDLRETASHDIHVFCIGGSELARWSRSAPIDYSTGAYRIGLWFWETDQLTPETAAQASLLDEIWVTSDYTAKVVKDSVPTRTPVLVMPLGMFTPPSSTLQLSRQIISKLIIGVPAKAWWCGTSFDIASQVERKNPFAMIDAWKLAFPKQSDQRFFVIKTMNGEQQPRNLEGIKLAAAGRHDIMVVDATWTPDQQHHFVRSLDVYLSLHRSEGYGLMLLEALGVGTPALATGATGNLAFMDDTNSWLIPAIDHVLDADAGPYRKGAKVSEPSIEAAADRLARLFNNEDHAATTRKVEKGRSDVAGLMDGTLGSDWIRRRLAEIRMNR